MKKFKFLKNKLWLSSFALTTMGSLVLAACGHNNTSSETVTPTTPADPTPTPVPTMVQATEAQKAVVTELLSNHGFMAYLEGHIADVKTKLNDNAKIVEIVGKINKTTVAASETKLGKAADAASKEDGKTAFAYLNQVKTDLPGTFSDTTAKTTFETKFNALVAVVNTTATNLTTEIGKLSAKNDDKLKVNVETLTKAIDAYIDAKEANAVTDTWKAVEKAIADLETATKTITTNLSELIKATFALDAAVTEVASYVNANAPDFIKTETNVKTLNKFVDTVRKDVLGTIGKDLWQADAPASVTVDTSLLLYSVVVQLADEAKAFTELHQGLKTLRFSKALTLKNDVATNLLALHVDDATYLDVSRLNAYLLHQDTDAVKILQENTIAKADSSDTTKVSLEAVLLKLVEDTKWFWTYLMPNGDKPTKVNADLTDALSTTNITEAEKKVITNFQTAFDNLKPELQAMYSAFFDAQSNTSFVGMANNLVVAAQRTNTAIGLAQNFGSVLNVVAASKHMGMLATNLDKNLPTTVTREIDEEKAESTSEVKKIQVTETKFDEKLPWVVANKNLQNKLNANTNETDYAKALRAMGEYNFTTTGLAAKMAKIVKITEDAKTAGSADDKVIANGSQSNSNLQQIAENEAPAVKTYTFSGYLYTNVQLELVKLAQWFTAHTKDKLAPSLKKIIDLAEKQLSPSQGSQTAQMMVHLAETYNTEVTKS